MAETLVGLGAIFWIAIVLVAVLWIVLPFAVFGTKPLLRELIAEQKRTSHLLELAQERAPAARSDSLVSAQHRLN
jgi:hypothetical protein